MADHGRRWWILAVLCLSVLLVVVDNTIVNVALPTISRDLHASTPALQWVVDGYTLSFAGLLLLGGNLGDRLGRRRFLQLGLVLFGVFSVGAALSRGTGELIAARALMGASAALVYPATLAILNNVFTVARERAIAIGVWSAVSGLAVAIGPVSGGALLRHFSWASVFYVSVPVAVIALVLGRLLLPESRDPRAGRFDPLGAVLSAAGITLLTWSIIEAPRHGWGSFATVGGIAGSLVILSGFAWWQARRPDPMLDVRLFRNPRFSTASAAIALAFFGLFGFIFMIASTPYWGKVIVAMALMAAGLGLTTGPATDAIMGALPRAKAGAGSAVNDTTREVGGTLGVAIVGSVLNSAYGSHVAGGLVALGAPVSAGHAAGQSVVAGMNVAARFPAPLRDAAASAVQTAFMAGLHRGSLVAAGTALAAALVALAFVPSHPAATEDLAFARTDPAGSLPSVTAYNA